jgi:hypothetical protein
MTSSTDEFHISLRRSIGFYHVKNNEKVQDFPLTVTTDHENELRANERLG